MNLPLQQRAGANIGLIPTYIPRSLTATGKTLPLVLGDQLLFSGPDEGVRFVGAREVFNTSLVALAGIDVELLIKDALGNEISVTNIAVAAATAVPGNETKIGSDSPTSDPITLAPGEQLITRTTGVGYVGGAFIQAGYADLYGVQSVRAILSTTLQTVLALPPGKSAGGLLGGDAPGFVANYDTAANLVDVYVNDGVTDQLVLKGWPVTAGNFNQIPLPALGAGQSVKMALRAAITTPGKTVTYMALFMLNDEPSEV